MVYSNTSRHAGLETPVPVQDVDEALKRLPQDEVDARNQRLKRAMDLSLKHEYLPKELQAVQTPYLSYVQVNPFSVKARAPVHAFMIACPSPWASNQPLAANTSGHQIASPLTASEIVWALPYKQPCRISPQLKFCMWAAGHTDNGGIGEWREGIPWHWQDI